MVSPLRGLWFAWLNYSAFDVYTSIDTCMGAERGFGVLVL